MHAVHKIIAGCSVASRSRVDVGEILEVEPDMFAIGVDRNADEAQELERQLDALGVSDLPLAGRIFGYFDHAAPAPFPAAAAGQRAYRMLFRRLNIPVADGGAGISHVILPERGLVGPGSLVLISDSHAPTMGAVGAYASCLAGGTLSLLARGRWWVDVPPVDLFRVEGTTAPGVYGRDVALHINRMVGQRGALGRVVEYTGSFLSTLSMDMRFTLCNTATEMGATSAYVQPDEITARWGAARGHGPGQVKTTDADFIYSDVREFDVTGISPQVAAPHAPDNVFPVEELVGTRIDQAFVGSCASGRLEDIAAAAEVLRGRRVHPEVQMIVTPGSREVIQAATSAGYIDVLNEAGAIVTHANCGSCAVLHGGVLAPGDVAIASNTRNFQGRMGPGASIHLASPATVAASAIEGHIADPRHYLAQSRNAS